MGAMLTRRSENAYAMKGTWHDMSRDVSYLLTAPPPLASGVACRGKGESARKSGCF